MARDIEVDVKVNDKTRAGLTSAERNFRESGRRIDQEYERFGNRFGDRLLGAVGAVSPKMANYLADSVGTGAKLGAPVLVSTLTGAAAAAAPVVAGLIGSAVAVSGVAAGITAGVALAARDSRVKAEGAILGSQLLAGLQDRAGVFVQPVLQSIDLIKKKFIESGDTIESIFQNSARFVVPLADAIGDLGQSLLEGIDSAISNSGPVIEALTAGLRSTGETIKGFMEDVTGNANANAAILSGTFQGLNSVISTTGQGINFVSTAFGALNEIVPLSVFTTNGFSATLDKVTDSTAGAIFATSGLFNVLRLLNSDNEKAAAAEKQKAEAMRLAGEAAKVAEADSRLYEKALKDNAAAARQTAQAHRSLFDDTTRIGEAQAGLTKALEKNGRTLSSNTEKGRANRNAISQLASAFNNYRGNLEASGASAATVNGVLSTQRNRLISAATAMGLSASKARELANQLLGIKPRRAEVTLPGAATANSQARNLRQELNLIKSKTVSLTVNVNAPRLASVENRLARLQRSGYAAAGQSFALAEAGQRGARVGGAVQVQNSVSVNLDGVPFYDFAATAVEVGQKRTAFRNHVGRRDAQ